MSTKKPTFEDIAREAGVSLTAVSLAFSGKGRISEEVRGKILNIADRLGYQRRNRNSVHKKSAEKNIALLLHTDPEYSYLWYFFQPTISEIDAVFSAAGYNLVILPIEYHIPSDKLLRKISDSGVGAVFSIHYANKSLFSKLEKMEIPIILLNNNDYQDRFFTVSFDDIQGAYEGAAHLIELGHTKIAYVEYIHRGLFSIKSKGDRFFGFKKAIDECHLQFNQNLKLTVDHRNMTEIEQKITGLFTKEDRPTAVFVHDDYLALRVIAALQKLHLSIPEDVSLVAPGDTLDYSEPHIPSITTMRINTSLIGKISAELMLSRLHNNPDDIQVLKVKEQLVKRGSCRKL